MGILSSLKIVEFAGLGPGPFCGMHLADLGAEVIVIERADAATAGTGDANKAAVFKRGKRSIALDLKQRDAVAAAKKIVGRADALIEGMRPGVMERLGLGPDDLRQLNPRLVYGRMTGWGQTGPLAHAAGHDINYVSLSGAAWYGAQAGSAPVPPPSLVGDIGGGALYLAIGILAGVIRARETGEGSVVDAAIVDGSAHMLNLLMSLRASGGLPDERGKAMLDGAPFYDVYSCSDGRHVSLGPLEPKFYALLREKLGLADDPLFAVQFDPNQWPAAKRKLSDIIAGKPAAHWRALFEGTDVCFAPVLNFTEAAAHPHMKARGVYGEVDGVMQTAPAPRFDGRAPEQPGPIPQTGAHTEEILKEAGLCDDEIAALKK